MSSIQKLVENVNESLIENQCAMRIAYVSDTCFSVEKILGDFSYRRSFNTTNDCWFFLKGLHAGVRSFEGGID